MNKDFVLRVDECANDVPAVGQMDAGVIDEATDAVEQFNDRASLLIRRFIKSYEKELLLLAHRFDIPKSSVDELTFRCKTLLDNICKLEVEVKNRED